MDRHDPLETMPRDTVQVTFVSAASDAPADGEVTGRELLVGVAIIWAIAVSLIAAGSVAVGVLMAVLCLMQGEEITSELIGSWSAKPLFVAFQVGLSLLLAICTATVTWYFLCRRHKRSLKRGYVLAPLSAHSTLACVATGLVCAAIAAVLMSLFSTGESAIAKMTSTLPGYLVFAVFAAIAPPLEEMYYRGFLFNTIRRILGMPWAWLLVSVWFCIPHVLQLVGDYAGIPVILVMGAIWTWQRYRYESLLAPILCHTTYNVCLVSIG